MAVQNDSSTDPKHHSAHIRQLLADASHHAREDISKVQDPKARALFETTAEVLDGLQKAYADFDQGTEMAWK